MGDKPPFFMLYFTQLYNYLGDLVIFSEESTEKILATGPQISIDDDPAQFLLITDSNSLKKCALAYHLQSHAPFSPLFPYYQFITRNSDTNFKKHFLKSFLQEFILSFINFHEQTLDFFNSFDVFFELDSAFFNHKISKSLAPILNNGDPLIFSLVRLYCLEQSLNFSIFDHAPLFLYSCNFFDDYVPPETRIQKIQYKTLNWDPPKNLSELRARFQRFYRQHSNRKEYVPLNGLKAAQSSQSLSFFESQQTLKKQYPSSIVDDFLSKNLTMHQINALSSEQLDVVFLAFQAFGKQEHFILADETGLGKGRALATLAHIAIARQIPVLFVTEKTSLFTDFWRDIMDSKDTNHSVISPALLHKKGKIYDSDGSVLFKTTSKDYTNLISGTLKSNLIFTTYSQINTNGTLNDRVQFLIKYSKNALVILDESHNASGESNTNKNIQKIIKQTPYVIFSSATFASKLSKLNIYKKCIPTSPQAFQAFEKLFNDDNLILQQKLSSSLYSHGTLIRREHPIDAPIRSTILSLTDADSVQFSFLLNQFSIFVQKLYSFAYNTQKIRFSLNLEPVDFLWARMGSNLSRLSRQIHLLSKINSVFEYSLKFINDNKKPVIALESTFESFILQQKEQDHEIESNELPPLYLKDILQQILKFFLIPEEQLGAFLPQYQLDLDEIRSFIHNFPNLIASPIDLIRDLFNQNGIRCGEISGRQFKVDTQAHPIQIIPKNDPPRETIIQSFNNGNLDVLILTKAGSTGLSIHSSNLFQDQRPRFFIELEMIPNPIQRAQFLGRVRRKNQICEPAYFFISTKSPFERRLIERSQSLLQNLQSITSGSQQILSGDFFLEFNFVSRFGDLVAYDFLFSNPHLCRKIGLFLQNKTLNDTFGLSEDLLKRACLLDETEQNYLFNFFEHAFSIHESYLFSKHNSHSFINSATLVHRKTLYKTNSPENTTFESNVFFDTYAQKPIVMSKEKSQINLKNIKELLSKMKTDFSSYSNFSSFFHQLIRPSEAQFSHKLSKAVYQKAEKLFSELKPLSLVFFFHPELQQHVYAAFVGLNLHNQPAKSFSQIQITLYDFKLGKLYHLSLIQLLIQAEIFIAPPIRLESLFNTPFPPIIFSVISGHQIYSSWVSQALGSSEYLIKTHHLNAPDFFHPIDPHHFHRFPHLPVLSSEHSFILLQKYNDIVLLNHFNPNESWLKIQHHPKGFLISIADSYYGMVVDQYLNLCFNSESKQSPGFIHRVISTSKIQKALSILYNKNIILFQNHSFDRCILP